MESRWCHGAETKSPREGPGVTTGEGTSSAVVENIADVGTVGCLPRTAVVYIRAGPSLHLCTMDGGDEEMGLLKLYGAGKWQ